MWPAALICAAVLLFQASTISANEGERPVTRDYALVTAPPAPVRQTVDEALAKTEGCQSCHVATEAPTMHVSPAVRLGCTDCHGGNAAIRGNPELPRDDPAYAAARDAALMGLIDEPGRVHAQQLMFDGRDLLKMPLKERRSRPCWTRKSPRSRQK